MKFYFNSLNSNLFSSLNFQLNANALVFIFEPFLLKEPHWGSQMIGTLGVAVHTSGTVDETVGLNCDLKRLKAKPQTTKQYQQHALVVF